MIQIPTDLADHQKLYEETLSTIRKKDPKLNNLRANVKINFFESFIHPPLLLQNVTFSFICVNSELKLDGSEVITMWGKQLEGFMLQLKTSCEKVFQIITKLNDQESFKYVQNYVLPNEKSDQSENDILKIYEEEISTADRMKFNIEANIMRYNIFDKDADKFALESHKTTVVRKKIYQNILKPLLDMYKQVYQYQIQGDIIMFDFRSGNYMPSITNIREYKPTNGLYENLYYTCTKMYNAFCRGNNTNSYDFYNAMNSLYQKFLNDASQIGIQTMAHNALANLDVNNIEDELVNLQNDILAPRIQQNKFIDSYRIIALSLINIAINGYGTNTFENVNFLGINFCPNILSKSQNHMIFHLKNYKENFLDRVSAQIKVNSQKMKGPNLSKLNFESKYQYIVNVCQLFSENKRNEYNQKKIEYNDKRKELENLLLSKDIANFHKDASQSEVESLKSQINNNPFNISISNGMATIELGPFSVKVNFGVIIHFRQKFRDLKVILEKVKEYELLIQLLDVNDKIVSLYNDFTIIKNDSQNIAFEIRISGNEKNPDIYLLPIRIPRHF